MAKFNKGDKVRYNDKTNTAWYGVEGVVEDPNNGSGNATVTLTTGANGWAAHYKRGDTANLGPYNLELVEPVKEVKRGLAVGDRVRTNKNAIGSDWQGIEGIVVNPQYVGESARFKITANPPEGWRIGDFVVLPPHKFDVIEEAAEALPREVTLSEIRVGDTVRVTYPEHVKTTGDVTQTVTRVREAKVSDVRGLELDDSHGYLINAYLEGWGEVVYTLLERPEPAPVRTTATEPVGSQFKTTGQYAGPRLLTKIADDRWTDVFLNTGNVYVNTDAVAQEAFDDRSGEWLEV